MTERKNIPHILTEICALVLFGIILAGNKKYEQNVRDGVLFCVNVIIPSLFVLSVLSKLFVPSILKLFGGLAPFTLIFVSLLCGSPVCAGLIKEMRESGEIGKKEAEILLPCTSNVSLPFVVGFAGRTVLGSMKAGFFMACAEIVIAFGWYIVMSHVFLSKAERGFRITSVNKVTVTEAISTSAVSIGKICACIVFYMCVSSVIMTFMPQSELIRAAVNGFLEFSGGLSVCAEMRTSVGYIVSAMIIGWGGMCVAMQISLEAGNKIGMKMYFLGKIIECLLMGMVGVLTKSVVC